MSEKQIKWLLNGDASIRYQVLRDVTRVDAGEIDAVTLLINKQTTEGF